jgi:hypothetical protein
LELKNANILICSKSDREVFYNWNENLDPKVQKIIKDIVDLYGNDPSKCTCINSAKQGSKNARG